MKMLLKIIWNTRDHRPRAFIRISLQLLLMTLLSGIAGLPLFLLFNLSPLFSSSSLLLTASSLSSLFGIVVSVWLAGRILDQRKFFDYGFHLNASWWRDFWFGILLGAFLMAAIFLVELSAGWIEIQGNLTSQDEQFAFPTGLVLALLLFISVGFQEELLFRGYQLRNIAEGLDHPLFGKTCPLLFAWVLTSILFGLLHLGNPNASLVSTLNITLAGLFLGLGFIFTGELAIPIGLHISWNFFQGIIFGFPVSGLAPTVSAFHITQAGPDLWTGGAFGPEAGLISILAMLVGSICTLAWIHRFRGKMTLETSLAEYQYPSIKNIDEPLNL